jgi:NodT family efflux transporter outer membrane factor (OMF) lipoprotein
MKNIVIIITATALLSSCGLYKNYERPTDIKTDGFYHCCVYTDSLGIGGYSWKSIFTDPNLQALIEKGLEQNTDLKNARLQIEQAEAVLKAAKWAFIPNLALAPQGQLAGVDWGKASQTYTLPVSASWQLDLFGGLLNAKKRAKAQLENSEAYKQAVQSQLIAAIANYYYTLAMLNEQLNISMQTEQLWKENVNTTKALMEAGQSNMAAVAQTEANYINICTQVVDLKDQIAILGNEFAALLGDAPQKYTIGTLNDWKSPYHLDLGMPSYVLSNRPDVKMAEQQLATAFYATNEARAAFYPAINLSGAIGWTNSLGGVIINPGQWIWNAIGSLTQPLFMNGRLRAQYKISKAQQEQAKNTFQQTLLNAGTEVDSILTKIESTSVKEKLYNKQVESLEIAVKSTQALMMNSSTNYLQVLTAQQGLLGAQIAQINNKFHQIQAVIELYQALGGGTK